MKSVVLGMLAETPVHPGAGRSLGVVDLPVAREAATGYPVIVGSSLKGSLREAMEQRLRKEHPTVQAVFGNQTQAGAVMVSDARLLLLPVRSLAGASRWVTCPHVLERYGRDLQRAGDEHPVPVIEVSDGTALASGTGPHLFLEERLFTVVGTPDSELVARVLPLVPETVHKRLQERLVVLSDKDFAWFCEFGLPVNARNQLNDDKASQNLWYEETLPPDTLMYSLLLSSKPDSLTSVEDLVRQDRYLQVGGNATVGQGWFALTWRGGSEQ